MEYSEFEQLFCKCLAENRIAPLNSNQIKQFYEFDQHLSNVNKITNLTAIRDPLEAISKHYADSLLASAYLPQNARVLDIGCGPGFPSIPLAIARPDLQIVAVDSTSKKIAFVNESAALLKATNLKAISGRAEDPKLIKELGCFSVVVSRAVARMNILCELCLPYVAINGFLLALKAAKAQEETEEAANCIYTLGGSDPTYCHHTLTNLDDTKEPRCLVKIIKTKPTPHGYPRAYGQIIKKPL